ncbi:PEP-CTERM sorting domain-containing protein [Haloferula sargassicola]|uniref:PEP-CTERM protein-sorting domain-containing protein n=1 Tax=Haloferula sargassicola TaxID=490096 RepID=A0ABP9UTD5_9BACT
MQTFQRVIPRPLVALALLAIPSFGSTVLIDFGRHDGVQGNPTVNPDTNGHYWNNLTYNGGEFQIPSGQAYNDLVDTSNVATTIDVTTTSIWRSNGVNNGGLLAPSAGLLGDFAIATATQDYWFTETGGSPALNNTASLVISGLDPGLTYDLRLFGTRESTSTRETQYVIQGGNGPFSASYLTSGTGIGDGGYNGNNDEIISFSGIEPDGSGNINVTINALQGGFAYLGVMEISSVPEPSHLAMVLGAGLVGLMRRRRQA